MKLTEAQARKWIRNHWAEFVLHADCPDLIPDDAAYLWTEECRKICLKLRPAGRALLKAEGDAK